MPDLKFRSELGLATPFSDYDQSKSSTNFQQPLCKRIEVNFIILHGTGDYTS
jgi:hypothetical protein